ncbi:MAG: hypothetical protein H0X66_13190 [Verrucomicrobia bacterium]|nr:hypothetical protein [Verrucomicrobiota bacterium]
MKVVSLCRILPILTLAVVGVIVSGCASHKHTSHINFQPNVFQPLVSSPKASLRVAEFQDYRHVTDKAVLVSQRNGHGYTTSGVVAGQEPLAGIFRDGLIQVLEENNFELAPTSGMYELRGGIRDLTFNVVTDFWGATGRPKLQVHFELVNRFSGNSVWKKTYTGGHALSTPWSADATMVKLFNESANDVLQQLLADNSFRRYFETRD